MFNLVSELKLRGKNDNRSAFVQVLQEIKETDKNKKSPMSMESIAEMEKQKKCLPRDSNPCL